MTVFALWSAPRARSTAFFRSMVERGDLVALHEPFYNLRTYGETEAGTEAGGTTFTSPEALLAWLRDGSDGRDVFLKETTDHRHPAVLADRRFLADARHALLLRRPEEIAASYYALFPQMSIHAVGFEAMHELDAAIVAAGGRPPVVVDSDDLVARPGATMAAYCAAVGLPFVADALTWEPGERREWQRTARWHAVVSASDGLSSRPATEYPATVETSHHLARLAAHHRPFYEELHARRLVVPWAQGGGSR